MIICEKQAKFSVNLLKNSVTLVPFRNKTIISPCFPQGYTLFKSHDSWDGLPQQKPTHNQMFLHGFTWKQVFIDIPLISVLSMQEINTQGYCWI